MLQKNHNFKNVFFPLSSQYDEKWIKKNSLGENVLYNLESLCEVMEFKPGMKVLDLACGKAVSAIFLAREFDVQVWAVDQFISATENYERVKEMQVEDKVYPIHVNARELPFPAVFFDAIVVVDSYMYFGTDEKYAPYLSQFLKPNGTIGIVDICFSKEINYLAEAPEYIRADYKDNWYFVHSLEWWYKTLEKSGVLKVQNAEIVPQNEFIRHEYIKDLNSLRKNDYIAEALSKDNDMLINIFRLVAARSEKEIDMGNYSAKT